MPNRRSTPLTDLVSSHTMGLVTFATPSMIPATARATFSGSFMATRLGTNSPNTRVK